MRLDKFICKSTEMSRNEAKKALRYGQIKVDGAVVKSATFSVEETHQVTYDGDILNMLGDRYIMLHKPEEMICSNVDEIHPSILHLIDIPRAFELNIAGRLDADTTGLVLLSDDGQWAHKITSPKKQCEKVYRVVLLDDITDEMTQELEQGVQLNNEADLTKPAKVHVITPRQVELTIFEGKYHQVKRMFAAVGNKVLELHRLKIADITLDDELAEGQWRYLTEQEIASIK